MVKITEITTSSKDLQLQEPIFLDIVFIKKKLWICHKFVRIYMLHSGIQTLIWKGDMSDMIVI